MALNQKCIWVLLPALLLVGCVTGAHVAEAPQRGVTQITDHITDAGAGFSLALMPDSDRVAIHITWPNDWAHSNNLTVASALGANLMSAGGAGERSAKEITKKILKLGSSASLVASPNNIYATLTSDVKHLNETINIMRDVFASPELNEQQFNGLKNALTERVESRLLKPSAKLWSVARRSLIGDGPLADYWNNLPIESVVAPLVIDDVKRWHKETFTQQGLKVSVAGPLNAEASGKAIDRLLASLPSKPSTTSPASRVSPRTGFTVLLHDKTIATTLIAVIGLLPPSSSGGEVSDIVAVSALGKGKESLLVKAQKQQLPDVGVINTSIANFSRDIRVFGISTEADDENASKVLDLIEGSYRKFKLADLDDQSVLRASVAFANSLKKSAQQVDVVAYGLGQLQLDELPNELLLSVMQDTLTLKAKDINQRIAEQYPNWDSMLKVVMSSDAEIITADCVIDQIEQLDECEF